LAVAQDASVLPSEVSAVAEGLELAFCDNGALRRLRIDVEIDGQPVGQVWQESFDSLLAFFDRSGNGTLEADEAARLPSAFELRQLLWGALAISTVSPPFEQLDLDHNEHVTGSELADFYRRQALGNTLIGMGGMARGEFITARLMKCLDPNQDGRIGDAEWQSFVAELRKLDANDDELITPDEIDDRADRRWWQGAALMTAPIRPALPPPVENAEADDKSPEDEPGDSRPVENPPPITESLPFIVLPQRLADHYWCEVLVKRLDRDSDGGLSVAEHGLSDEVFAKLDRNQNGRLVADEVAEWRSLPADEVWTIRLSTSEGQPASLTATSGSGKDAPGASWLSFCAGHSQFHLRTGPGNAQAATLATTSKSLLARFAEVDKNQDGQLEAAETTGRESTGFAQLLGAADRDNDRRMSQAELADWLELQRKLAASHGLLTVLDCGFGLFGTLDGNHDGSLSLRELRTARQTLESAGCLAGERLNLNDNRRTILGMATPGRAEAQIGPALAAAPAWFTGMDRNGDGDVSRREFVGQRSRFETLDADGDGFISISEATSEG
jgi:hypothetical protein